MEKDTKQKGCLNCTKRYWNCQDECPDKSKGTLTKPPEAEYYAYKASRYTEKLKRQRRH